MTDMSSTDHYDAAEKLLKEAGSYREPDTRAEWCLELAKMHLALSQASIAARALDLREKATATSARTTSAGSRTSSESPFGDATPVPANPQRHGTSGNTLGLP
jgi:hypothetical protein